MIELKNTRTINLYTRLKTYETYSAWRRILLLIMIIAGMLFWTSAIALEYNIETKVLIIILLLAGLLVIAKVFDWLLRGKGNDIEEFLELCRSGFVGDLKSENANELKQTALAIGEAVKVLNKAKITFGEHEVNRYLSSYVIAIFAFVMIMAMAMFGAPQKVLHQMDFKWDVLTMSEFIGGLFAITFPFFLVTPRQRFELRLFEAAEDSWFDEIAATLKGLKEKSISVGEKVKGNVQVGASSKKQSTHPENEPQREPISDDLRSAVEFK